MTERYIYTDKVGAGPEHPAKRWGLFTEELSSEEAMQRYALPVSRRDDWFGIVRTVDDEAPSAYLQMCPQANGVVLHTLDRNGSVAASYSWGAYATGDDADAGEGAPRLFLNQIVWYVYPEAERFLDRFESLGNVRMEFTPQGYGKEVRTTKRGPGEPASTEEREYNDVDVSVNWFAVPAFGQWDPFFNPTPDEE